MSAIPAFPHTNTGTREMLGDSADGQDNFVSSINEEGASIGSTCATTSRYTHAESGTTAKVTVIKCRICRTQTPADVCCFTCDPAGVPFHEGRCWKEMPLHIEGHGLQYQIHRPAAIASLVRLRYLNEPNKQTSIPHSKFKEDKSNCFIEFKELFRFGDRAFPLLRGGSDGSKIQYPSFVSFVGRSMHGKSFLIRALQYREADTKQPAPIPCPGAKERNHDSTSSDIHLYADSATACDESPILLLDCEGFDGTDVPISLKVEGVTDRPPVKTAYPRLVYVFSTCVVFVTSGPLGGSDDIKAQLISYASQGASGSRNQGFKPSLFVIFNRFEGGDAPDFDWSIKASSDAFLKNRNLAILDNFYSRIHVVYIPRMNSAKAAIALQQLDAFNETLRAEHEKAFQQRQAFRLDFTPGQLTAVLQRALDHLSKDSSAVFDWALEAPSARFSSNQSNAILVDLWTQYLRHHTNLKSSAIAYDRVRKDFLKHTKFCLRLRLSRNRPYGTHIEDIPPQWDEQMVQLCLEYTPCGVSQNGVKCGKVQFRHGDYHEDLCTNRWKGEYKRDTSPAFRTFRDSFKEALKGQSRDVSIGDLSEEAIPEDIRSVVSCLGCLQEPPSTMLSCGHAFCFNCIRELTPDQPLPHRLNDIPCPIHNKSQKFSPRILPLQSAYRILSLDGGGVNGLAQLVILRHIEKRCFDVPVIHLFDLIVGTSIGGQIALALTIGTPSGPLTVAEATDTFPKLMERAFQSKVPLLGGTSLYFGKTKYKATPLESHLKSIFGETKLYSAPASSQRSVPNVAVTTVLDSVEARLVTNYNRAPLDGTLLFGPTPEECMPVWAAARCTSAAFPYFKPLEWQGQMLFDGGFKLNCPAARAYSEAKSIWPHKHCDILLSLGTGTTPNRPPQKLHTFVGVATAIAGDISDAQKAWDEFQDGPLQRFRLNPGYRGTGFELDDVRKLNDIQKQTEEWIAAKDDEVTNICDRLIAALFFFCPSGAMNDGVLVGEILCRLPADLGGRQKLVEGMLRKADLPLFAVKYNGKTLALVKVGKAFRDLRSNAELRLKVKLCDFPATGEVEIDVEMRSLDMHPLANFQWLPISGSPYVIRKNLHGLEDLDALATDITGNVQLDPQHPHPIDRGVGREVYRGLYASDTPQIFSKKVAISQLPVVSAGVEQRKLEQQVKHKVAIWRNLKHPNVTQFLGVAYVFPGRPPCLVYPLAPRIPILAYIGKHPDSKYRKAREVALGVQYLHYKGIVHGDLRVENVSVIEDVAQIKFSMSRILDMSGFAMKILRDIRFNAPELINTETGGIPPTLKSDIFSLSILFLQLFHGPDKDLQRRLPYNHVRNNSTYDLGLLHRICGGERPMRDKYTAMSNQHWNILSKCWQGDPSARPDINWVVDAL